MSEPFHITEGMVLQEDGWYVTGKSGIVPVVFEREGDICVIRPADPNYPPSVDREVYGINLFDTLDEASLELRTRTSTSPLLNEANWRWCATGRGDCHE